MPQQAPVNNIRSLSGRVKYVAVACTSGLWGCICDGSLWINSSAAINIPPRSGNTSTTIQTYEGGVLPITVYRSGCLVGVDNSWLNSRVIIICYDIPEWVHDTCKYFYRPSYFSW